MRADHSSLSLRVSLIVCLALAACAAPNSSGLHRELVLSPGEELTTAFARSIARQHIMAGEEPPLLTLEGLTGRDGKAVLAEVRAAGDTIDDEMLARLELVEDLVEGTFSELLGERIDVRSPTPELALVLLRVVDRKTLERVHSSFLEVPWLTPVLSWSVGYLAVHLGPEHWDDIDPHDPLVQRFSELAASYALSGPGRETSRALSALRLVEQAIYARCDVSAEEAAANDPRYDALLAAAEGYTLRLPLSDRFSLRLSNSNWTPRSLLHTYAHEVGHFIQWDRSSPWRLLRKAFSTDAFASTLEENTSDMLADLVVERIIAQRMALPGVHPTWLDDTILERVPLLSPRADDRLSDLYSTSRRVGTDEFHFDLNQAAADTGREYRSLQQQLRALVDVHGLSAALKLILTLDSRADLDQLVTLAEATNAAVDSPDTQD